MISKNVFNFLKKLEKNNSRDWFNDNKPEFKTLETEVKSFYNTINERLNTHDETDKVKVFRIYRDVRFSKNKLPYKTHLSGSFHRVKPRLRGGYYFHIQPNNESFISTGFWDPAKEDLLRIRKEFEMDDEEIRTVINNKDFKSVWGELEGEELKTAPKGFDKEHSAIDLIRKKQFVFTRKLTDKEVQSKELLDIIDNAFVTIRPYFDYMSAILTTDLNGESLID